MSEKCKLARCIGVLTGGGDAPGMNAALRAVSRAALAKGWHVYGIRNGFHGLDAMSRDGSPFITDRAVLSTDLAVPMQWDTMSWAIRDGGSTLGTLRCEKLKTDDSVKRRIARKLCDVGIEGLIVIGGNGSLQGANAISKGAWEETQKLLPVVVVPASIDNDIPDTEKSIGVDTALNVIVENVDRLVDTISAVNRVIVLETMGRDCGCLAVLGALASGAVDVFCPERPLTGEEIAELLKRLQEEYARKRRFAVVVIGEGAAPGVKISPTQHVVNCINLGNVHLNAEESGALEWDVRTAILGHIQRGGPTSAFDRILATRMGARAVDVLETLFTNIDNLSAPVTPETRESMRKMVALRKGEICGNRPNDGDLSLKSIIQKLKPPNSEGGLPKETLIEYAELVRTVSSIPLDKSLDGRIAQCDGCIGILTSGADAPAMNMVLRSASIYARNVCNYQTLGFLNGFDGLIHRQATDLTWDWIPKTSTKSVDRLVAIDSRVARDLHLRAGSIIGVDPKRPGSPFEKEQLQLISECLHKLCRPNQHERNGAIEGIEPARLKGIVVIGGLDTALRVKELDEYLRSNDSIPNVNIVYVPASIDHGLPGTHATLGFDSALNAVVDACDRITDTSQAGDRVGILETMGGGVGALGLMGALAAGTEAALVPEKIKNRGELSEALRHLKHQMDQRKPPQTYATLVVTEWLYSGYRHDDVKQEAAAAMGGLQTGLDVRATELGYLQRGAEASFYDRFLGTVFGVEAVKTLKRQESSSQPANSLKVIGAEVQVDYLESALDGWSDLNRMEMAKELWNYAEISSLYEKLCKLAARVTVKGVESPFFRFSAANIAHVPDTTGVFKLYETADEAGLLKIQKHVAAIRQLLGEYYRGINKPDPQEAKYFRWIVCDDAYAAVEREQKELAEFKSRYNRLPKYNQPG